MAHHSGMTTVERAADEARPRAARILQRAVRRRDGRAPLWIELAIVAWLFWLYDVINNLAPTRQALARLDATNLLAFEHSLHIDVELTLDRWFGAHSVAGFIATYYYFFAHALVTLAVLVCLWWARPALYRRMRTQLVIINLIAFAVFWRYPLAPPRMFPGLGFRDIVALSHAVVSWHSGVLVQDADQYAAMPSLHIAWALWCALAVWQLTKRRTLRVLALAPPPLTALVVIATGNHYLLDVLAGAATMLTGVALQQGAVRGVRYWRRRAELPELREGAGAPGLGGVQS